MYRNGKNEQARNRDKEAKIKFNLEKMNSVSVDIWTHRTMRGFLKIIAHFMELSNPRLQSVMLSCERFTGSHTGESKKFFIVKASTN